VDLYDWLLFLHVLSAFVVVGALAALWALVLATRPPTPVLGGEAPMRVGKLAGPLVGVGMTGTLIFGIWLALNVDGYEIWDGWILAALVLWAIAIELGRRVRDAAVANAATLHWLRTLFVVLLLADMVWKPGA
jgi:hypothetical protein